MLLHQKIKGLEDFFKRQNERKPKGVYFYRINSYDETILEFIRKYYDLAKREGAIIDKNIENPTADNIAYFNEIIGDKYVHGPGFMAEALKKWLPRIKDYQRASIADGIYDTLEVLRRQGKNIDILKNNFIRIMCWLYYNFYNIMERLGNDDVPKIIFWGNVNFSELSTLKILSNAGADIILVQPGGDSKYMTIDPKSEYSIDLGMGSESFPAGFDLQWLLKQHEEDKSKRLLYSNKANAKANTNTWLSGDLFEDLKNTRRGENTSFFYNMFARINGCDNRNTYVNNLYLLYQDLKKANRSIKVINNKITNPSVDEISKIKRGNYANENQLIMDLKKNINLKSNTFIDVARDAFVDTMIETGKLMNMDLNKMMNKGIYILCWFQRYIPDLLGNTDIHSPAPILIYFGNVETDTESLFLNMVAKLPIDVIIFNPEKKGDKLTGERLYEVHFEETLKVNEYPTDGNNLSMGTMAYNAERDLDTMMYSDTGMYRDMQFSKANIIKLSTTYEEINIYWKQEARFRPNFSTVDDIVNIPVMFAKISGVANSDTNTYFQNIKDLLTDTTLIYKNENIYDRNCTVAAGVPSFFKNGRLDREGIKHSQIYKYDYLRAETQEYILDKLSELLRRKTIAGTGQNGTEYKIITIVLDLPKEILRFIQSFDFTKCPPKLIIVNTTETVISLEDSIIVAFLNLIGFDIVFFIPTGYDNVNKYFNNQIMEEHIIGNYLYDIAIPDFNRLRSVKEKKKSFFSRLFG
ncbi:hypothetical protein LSA36186_14690 [Lachnoanaerobaculum sp. JCM 36186]|uniref:YceG family protein n=1 Tax=Lachnoanaerobaculum sanguinis TaxID=3065809 RepID=UPI0027774160|nr:YceG family protein [Lachnoanaerobaculum sp. JCM 36186]GMO03220.1 hypothetical protein LSA36186_14690 [Lachnoanaerobaculum sp. JCM 36186]